MIMLFIIFVDSTIKENIFINNSKTVKFSINYNLKNNENYEIFNLNDTSVFIQRSLEECIVEDLSKRPVNSQMDNFNWSFCLANYKKWKDALDKYSTKSPTIGGFRRDRTIGQNRISLIQRINPHINPIITAFFRWVGWGQE